MKPLTAGRMALVLCWIAVFLAVPSEPRAADTDTAPAPTSNDVVTGTLVVQHQGAVSFVTGGVGTDERDQLGAMRKDLPFQVTFAQADGSMVADGRAIVRDAKGKVVLDTPLDGPILMAKLPGGAYTLDAQIGGVEKKAKFVVVAAKPLGITVTIP